MYDNFSAEERLALLNNRREFLRNNLIELSAQKYYLEKSTKEIMDELTLINDDLIKLQAIEI